MSDVTLHVNMTPLTVEDQLLMKTLQTPDINIHTTAMEHRIESSQHIHWNDENEMQ